MTYPMNCPKVPHDSPPGGYLHSAEDDSPYSVDGVQYCGRCHYCIPHSGHEHESAVGVANYVRQRREVIGAMKLDSSALSWIGQAHHHDGCDRRNGNNCTCGKEQIRDALIKRLQESKP